MLFSKLQTRNWNDLQTTPSLGSHVLILEMHPFCNTLVIISQTHETNKNASGTTEEMGDRVLSTKSLPWDFCSWEGKGSHSVCLCHEKE